MIYTNLNDLPMSRFISIYNGDYRSLIKSGKHDDQELKETSEKLIYEYISIVGGKSVQAELNRKNELLNTATYLEVVSACKNLILLEKWNDVCDILKEIGYNLKPENHEGIKSRIDSLYSSKSYQLQKLKSNLPTVKQSDRDPDYFVKELALVMTHFKMQIDKNRMSAKEYAYIVKRMGEEIEASIRINSRLK